MQQFIYTYKDDRLGIFARPWFTNYGPDEMEEIVRRSVLQDNQLKEVQGLSLYLLAKYEDTTGEIKQEFNFLLTIPKTRKVKKNENKK